jgi:hypothetical protein
MKMKVRLIPIAVAAAAGVIALAACGGGAGEPAGSPAPPAPAQPTSAGGAGGTYPAGMPVTADQFVGLNLDAATSFAEELGREWRIGREDGEDLPVTADFLDGRVTFTVEAGVVTAASIEEAAPSA